MKQIKALTCSNSQELLGRVTLNDKNIFNRSAYILVTNEKKLAKGYKAIVSTHDLSGSASNKRKVLSPIFVTLFGILILVRDLQHAYL